ncbi:MAG: signal peptidase I [Rhizobiaceae bacterium]
MNEAIGVRRFWPTLLISLFTGGFGAFLYLGKPWHAIVLMVIPVLLILALGGGWLSFSSYLLYVASGLALILTFVCLPLLFRKRAVPSGWSSKWYSAIMLSYLASLIVSSGLRSLAYQPFSIPTGSMLPTLVHGDILYANKFIYGYSRHSFPFSFPSFQGRTAGELPVRGDVVIFKFQNSNIDYVKRIVGMPGDTIQIVDGIPRINGAPVKHVALGPYVNEAAGTGATRIEETLPEGRSYTVLDMESGTTGDNTRIYEVPAGHYFVLGDHRDNALDSRYDVGFVSLESIVGRAERIVTNENDAPFADRRMIK